MGAARLSRGKYVAQPYGLMRDEDGMSIKTGIFRIVQVIKWFGVLALVALIFLDVAASFKLFGLSGGGELTATLFGVFVFVVCRVVAWVLEGFIKD
jgi:hypothetical protein